MATIAQTPVFDSENIKPQENIPTLANVVLKPSEVPTPAAEPVAEETVEETAEDDEESDSEEESDEEDDAVEQDEGEEIYPEDELSIEVDAPFSLEQEAREAVEMAQALGLDNPDAALSHLGAQDKRVSLTISKYAELIAGSEKEVAQLYDGLTTEINNLRISIDAGIRKVANDSQINVTNGAVDVIRSSMEQYLRSVVDRSAVHAEYRQSNKVVVQDILNVLSLMGRPLYWKSSVEEETEQAVETTEASETVVEAEVEAEDAMEEDAMEEEDDEDYSEEDDEEEDGDITMEQDETIEPEDENTVEVSSFKRLVDVMNREEGIEFTTEAYACLQATTEDFLVGLVQASGRSSHFAGRREVTDEDVRFAQVMTGQKW